MLQLSETDACTCRKVLLEQQTSLRLMQADPSYDDVTVGHSNRNALENAYSGFRKTAGKPADISPWESSVGPAHSYQTTQFAAKAGKKIKKAPVSKQRQLEIPPALTALLQTVKQVHATSPLHFNFVDPFVFAALPFQPHSPCICFGLVASR